ncbi:hypothetical protein BH24GEM2_BH24GEM2_12800 [soil metagenome]
MPKSGIAVAFALLFTFAAYKPAAGQQAFPAPEPCTYDTCALRVESSYIVRGREGTHVRRIGLFGPGLEPLVQGSERAVEYARIYDQARTPMALLTVASALAGGIYGLALIEDGCPFENNDVVRRGALVAGIGVMFYGTHVRTQAQRAFSRALWWYNRDLPE